MGIVNHLIGQETQNLFLAVAYGKHVVTGHLAKSNVSGASGTHTITVQQMLGRGEWDACEGLWFRGLQIDPTKYVFRRGKQTAATVLKTFTASSATDTITCTGHGYANGDQVIIEIGGTPPSPLLARRIYYVRDVTTNTFKLALTSGGAAIDLTTNGTGTLQIFRNDPDQGFDILFTEDTPHSCVAWVRAELPQGVGDFDTKNSPPDGLKGIFRTLKVNDYDTAGNVTGFSYSTNPARQIADLILRLGGRPASRIDWEAWCEWRDYLGTLEVQDYRTLPDFDGFGLWATYYNGTSFDTQILERIDAVVEFTSSAGSPGIGVNVDNFSAKYEGFLKPKHSETYTFSLTHTHGARLYIDDMVTPLIDQWATTGTHTATKTLTAGQYYAIRVEWKHTTGTAELRLQWSSASQPLEVIPARVLYPKIVNRPRYETHPFFASPTRLDDAVRTILALCNSTYQEIDGKLVFFCFEQLTSTAGRLRNDLIVNGSLRIVPRDILSLRNSWQVKFRDIDSQYLDEPSDPILIERHELIEAAGRRIDGEAIDLFNCSRWQAYKILAGLVQRSVDPKYTAEITGTGDSFALLAGDAVSVDIEFRNLNAQPMLVIESNDASSEETADERQFLLQMWTGQDLAEPDTEAPSVPTGLAATVISHAAIDWDWAAATDDIAVTGYEVSIDGGGAINAGNVLIYHATGLSASTTYGLRVRAYDAAGNRSAWSTEVSATTPLFNVALASNGTTATATSTAGGDINRTNNGVRYTGVWPSDVSAGGWDSSPTLPGTPQTAEYDFGVGRTISEVYVWTVRDGVNYASDPALTDSAAVYGIKDFTVDYWSGTSWVNIATVTGFAQTGYYTAFSPIATQKIRVRITDGNSAVFPSARLVEVEAWGY